jgi:predicted transcriptional regulator
MPRLVTETLSKKESQAMEVLYRLGQATVAQVQAELPDTPNYSATRGLLGVLVDKGHAQAAKAEGARHYIYSAKEPVHKARKGALRRLLTTFFDDSPAELVVNLLDPRERRMSPEEIEKVQKLIDAHRAARKTS